MGDLVAPRARIPQALTNPTGATSASRDVGVFKRVMMPAWAARLPAITASARPVTSPPESILRVLSRCQILQVGWNVMRPLAIDVIHFMITGAGAEKGVSY